LENYSSFGQRAYFAKKTSELIQEKPLLGWGTGAYHQEFCRVADNAQWCHFGKVHPHNQFLFIWVEHGVVGLALLLGLIFSPMWMTRNAPPHIRGLAAAYTGIFVVISMTHGSLWLSTESHFHTLMGALIFAGYKPSRST
jgi:O-antigen ligase